MDSFSCGWLMAWSLSSKFYRSAPKIRLLSKKSLVRCAALTAIWRSRDKDVEWSKIVAKISSGLSYLQWKACFRVYCYCSVSRFEVPKAHARLVCNDLGPAYEWYSIFYSTIFKYPLILLFIILSFQVLPHLHLEEGNKIDYWEQEIDKVWRVLSVDS